MTESAAIDFPAEESQLELCPYCKTWDGHEEDCPALMLEPSGYPCDDAIPAAPQACVPEPSQSLAKSATTFPVSAMIGSLGDFARVMAKGTEVPEEFFFTVGLTLFGNFCSGTLTANVAVDADPRFYLILLGESYRVKKSTALKRCAAFFDSLWNEFTSRPKLLWGVGSAEGLARTLYENNHVTLLYDELRAFIDKTKATGAVLLPMVTSLFEGRNWDNPTKTKRSISVSDAHLSMAACCTLETYADMWTPDALAIGLPNRLLVILAEGGDKVAWPSSPDEAKLGPIRERISRQLEVAGRNLALDATPEARRLWDQWYKALPSNIHTRRLDTIGFRLLMLLTVTSDKDQIDAEVTRAVISILNYEFAVRTLTDPFNAATLVAKMEQRIRGVLKTKGPCKDRDLKKRVHYEREGFWCYKTARQNVMEAGDVRFNTKTGCYEAIVE